MAVLCFQVFAEDGILEAVHLFRKLYTSGGYELMYEQI
jgi:hypothetical protein